MRALEILRQNINELTLTDPRRMKNSDKFHFTWKRSAPTVVFARLDYFLVPKWNYAFLEDINSARFSFRSLYV